MTDSPVQQHPTAELPLVSDLIAQYKPVIAAVRARPELATVLQPEHDDIFILRYVISFRSDVGKCADAIKRAILWRREHASVLARIDELQMEVRKIIPTGMLPWRTNSGQPIQVAIPFAVDAKTWSSKSEQWHHEAGISNREVAYRVCDRLTRQSGRLVKMVMIQDLTGLSMTFAMQNSKLMQNQGKLSKLSEFLFPQLVATVVVTHPPSFVSTLYKMSSAVLSERLMKKVKLADTYDKTCKYADLAPEKVPHFLGGQYYWDADWVPIRVKTNPANAPKMIVPAESRTADSPGKAKGINPFKGFRNGNAST